MKRLFALLLVLSLLPALAACAPSAPAPTEEPVPVEEPAPAEEPAPTEEPAAAEEPAPLDFSTTDREGNVWDTGRLADYIYALACVKGVTAYDNVAGSAMTALKNFATSAYNALSAEDQAKLDAKATAAGIK